MKDTMKEPMTVSKLMRSGSAIMFAIAFIAVLSVGCSQVEGSACNPALSHDECDNAPTVQCIQPTPAACNGQAYCCTATPNGDGTFTITSTDPNCLSLKTCQAPMTGSE